MKIEYLVTPETSLENMYCEHKNFPIYPIPRKVVVNGEETLEIGGRYALDKTQLDEMREAFGNKS